jgi:hypothetical protein
MRSARQESPQSLPTPPDVFEATSELVPREKPTVVSRDVTGAFLEVIEAAFPADITDESRKQTQGGSADSRPNHDVCTPPKPQVPIESPGLDHQEASKQYLRAESTESCQSEVEEGVPVGGERKRDRMRRWTSRLKHKVTERHRRRKALRTSSLLQVTSEAASLAVPASAPTTTQRLGDVTVDGIHTGLQGEHSEEAPLARVLEALGAFELSTSPWIEDIREPGTLVQRKRYLMPTPSDTPELLRKALSLPKTIPSLTVSSLGFIGDSLVLVQRSLAEGVPFSERVRFQNTHVFKPHSSGGVEWRQWIDTVWLEPLPWTQAFIARAIHAKAASEARCSAHHMEQALLAAAAADGPAAAGPGSAAQGTVVVARGH